MIAIGSAYYPEQWSLDRVEYDASLMRDAGLRFVRIGEFAWSRLEPEDGKFQFDHMIAAIRIFERYGIRVIFCTPGAAAPAWLVRRHPEVLIRKPDGTSAHFGVRQHTCYASPVYRKYLGRLVEKLADALQECTNLAGFQIDNEIGHTVFGLCHCGHCRKEFRKWLEERYGTLEELNRAWWNGFWSQDYSSWDEIEPGNMELRENSAHVLDSIRFHSAQKCAYLQFQAEILRRHFPGLPIAANNASGSADCHALYALVDRAGLDCYPTSEEDKSLSYPADRYAGMKPGVPFWVLETGVGGHLISGVPHSRRLSSHYWSFIAHGAELISIFWWRSAPGGFEKTLVGIVGHNGKPRRRYHQLKNWITELDRVTAATGPLPLPRAEAGILYDHENLWGYSCGFWRLWQDYENAAVKTHEACSKLHISSNVISPKESFDSFKIILMPSLLHISPEVAERLKAFVAHGGILIASGRTGTQDANAKFLTGRCPEHLSDLFGIALEDEIPSASRLPGEGEAPDPEKHVAFAGLLDGGTFRGFAAGTLLDAEVADAEILAAFENSDLAGCPAVTEKKYGKGRAIHINAFEIDSASFLRILRHAADAAGLVLPDIPGDVEILKRGTVTFLINRHGRSLEFDYAAADAETLLGERHGTRIALPPYGVCILKGNAGRA